MDVVERVERYFDRVIDACSPCEARDTDACRAALSVELDEMQMAGRCQWCPPRLKVMAASRAVAAALATGAKSTVNTCSRADFPEPQDAAPHVAE